MTTATTCPLCDKELNVPAGGDGRRVRCPGCSRFLQVREDDGPEPGLTLIGLCDHCGAGREPGDAYCQACGASLSVGAVELQPPVHSPRKRSRHAERARKGKMRRASGWVLAVAVLFALFGTFIGLLSRMEAQEALADFASLSADELVELEDGTEVTVGELRGMVESGVVLIFVINYGLALMMLACWFWSKRSSLPALVTALSIYLTVIVLNMVIDPATIVQGLVIKAFVIVALVNGVRAALAQRAAEMDG